MSLLTSLIDVQDSVLVVIDVQDAFLDKLALAVTTEQQQHEASFSLPPPPDKATIVSRIGWIMDLAAILQVPIIITVEDVDVLGGLTAPLQDKVNQWKTKTKPTTCQIYNKMIFGLADNPEILTAVQETGRKTVVLVGLETDVCIAHSALGLALLNYKVAVVQDAVASPGVHHGYGLRRLQQAAAATSEAELSGRVALTDTKGLYFEWIRTVAADNDFKNKHLDEIGTPMGIIL